MSEQQDRGSSGRRVVRRREHVYVISLLYAMLVVPCAALALDIPGNGIPVWLRIGAGVAGAVLVALTVRRLMIGVYLRPDGVLIRNTLRSRRLAWSEIDFFELGSWGGFDCGAARLTDGGQVTIYALNPPFGDLGPVPRLLQELNAELAHATGREDVDIRKNAPRHGAERYFDPFAGPWRIARRVAWVAGFALLVLSVVLNYVNEESKEVANPFWEAVFRVLVTMGMCAVAAFILTLFLAPRSDGKRERVWSPWFVLVAGVLSMTGHTT